MMGALKNYFEYKVYFLCGIPYITLEGTIDDWKKIRQKIEKLKDYGLE